MGQNKRRHTSDSDVYQDPNIDAFDSITDAQKTLRIGKTKLYELLRDRKIQFGHIGRKTVILRSSLHEFIRSTIADQDVANAGERVKTVSQEPVVPERPVAPVKAAKARLEIDNDPQA